MYKTYIIHLLYIYIYIYIYIDVDCGGGTCTPCSFLLACRQNSDCAFNATCLAQNCTPIVNYNVFQSGAQSVLTVNSVAYPTMTSLMQTAISSISGGVVAATTLTVNAGDVVRISFKCLYESSGNEYDTALAMYTAGPSTQSGYYDLAAPNYLTTKTGIFGTANIRTSGGIGAPGTLGMFDSNGIHYDTDYSSTPLYLFTNVLWKAPTSGTFTFYAVVICPGWSVRINAPWTINTSPNYEYGLTTLTVQVVPTNAMSNWNVFQSGAQSVLTVNSIAYPTMTSLMQTAISSISGGVVAATTLTVNAGDVVRIFFKCLYESNGNEYDTALAMYTAGPSTQTGYYDLAAPNYLTTKTGIFGTANIRTSGGIGAAGTLGMFESNGNLIDGDYSSTPQYLFTNVLWKAPTSGTFTFYAVVICPGWSVRINAPWTINTSPNYEYGSTTLTVQDVKYIN